MDPLPADARPELAATFDTFERILGVVPNSLLTMQRRPRIVAAFETLTEAVMDPESAVDPRAQATRGAYGQPRRRVSVLVRNAVTDEHMARLRAHWTDDQIVEILAAICLYAFLNRWNDTMATDLEAGPHDLGDRVLGRGGWTGGKHVHQG